MSLLRGLGGARRRFFWTVAVTWNGRVVYPYAIYPTKRRAEALRARLLATSPKAGPYRVVAAPETGL